MDDEVKTWLHDISNAITEIETFLDNKPKDFNIFKNNILIKRAVERDLEIIGEAMKLILDQHPHINFANARKIVDIRNRIIHGYDTVSDEVIWGVVIRHLPILKQEVQNMLKSE